MMPTVAAQMQAQPPADMNRHLTEMLDVVQRLISLVEAENHLLETERPTAIQPLLEEKGRLSSVLAYGLQALKRNPAGVEQADRALRDSLSSALATFQDLVMANGRIVLRLKRVSEGILNAIIEETQKGKRTTPTYNPGLATAPARPPAASIALNATV
ncbi:hypothetical protein [Pedomonas mirosovicensis]|uniref:hypothetical protein n=1 Tax=Pedomonas mirosovicensis TaxID=2908641 RepID=UPI0021697723|nr:hypothetical protein [Pedomonas mirosovicensis]MCH8685096.1 hypothetical protein [Pedomonas mirosovicensis]